MGETPLNQLSLQTFNSHSVQRCWYFCKFSELCHVFSYNYATSTCSLFPLITDEEDVKKCGVGIVTYSKHCVQGQACGNNNIRDLLKGSSGFFIQEASTKACLSALEGPASSKWGSCKQGEVIKWSVKEVRGPGTIDRVNVLIMQGNVGLERRQCVAWFGNSDIMMYKCRLQLNPKTFIQLTSEKYPFQNCPVSIIPASASMSGKVPIILRTTPPEEEENRTSPCRVGNSSIENGFLVEDPEVPFFQLPGENIIIKCLDTFGVEELGYVTEYHVNCSEDMVILNCTEKPILSTPTEHTSAANHPTLRLIFEKDPVTETLPPNPFAFSTIFLSIFVVMMAGLLAAAMLLTNWFKPKAHEKNQSQVDMLVMAIE